MIRFAWERLVILAWTIEGIDVEFLEVANQQNVLSSISNYRTAQGQLALGIEILNGNVATLQNQVNDYAQITDQKLDTAVTLTAEATTVLVNSQIIELQTQLSEVQSRIEEINARINDSTRVCQGFLGCGTCTQDSACVWCSAERNCVAGDRNGPLGGECTAYEYGNCDTGCASHSQCAACIADPLCGWCINGSVCMEGSATDPGSCDAGFWLYRDLQTGNSCPQSARTPTNSYVNANPTASTDSQLPRLQRDLQNNMSRAASLTSQIDSLQGQLEAIMIQMSGIDEDDIEDVQVDNGLVGLADIVDLTAQNEQIAEEVGEEISQDAVSAVETSNQERVQQEEQFMQTIRQVSEELIEQNEEQEEELQEQDELNQRLQEQIENQRDNATVTAPVVNQTVTSPTGNSTAPATTPSFLELLSTDQGLYLSFL